MTHPRRPCTTISTRFLPPSPRTPDSSTPITSACTPSRSQDPERFWGGIGRRIDWIKHFSQVKDTSFAEDDFHIRWFYDGTLNVSSNCLDRHLKTRGDKTAIIWEGDDPERSEHISYRELHERVCQCANALKSLGVKKGDRVTIYLPMIPETAVAMLACARIGATHSVVFAGFSSEALGGRIADCASTLVITADEGLRGGKRIPLKQFVDGALASRAPSASSTCWSCAAPAPRCRCTRRATAGTTMWSRPSRRTCAPEDMNAEDPLFILYTSGSTGKPKGVLHTTGGYLVYAAFTHQIRLRSSRKTISTGPPRTSAG